MVRTSRCAHTCPSLSLSLSNVLSFFHQITNPQKKKSSLSLSLRRVVYTTHREKKRKTKAFVLHCKTRLLLFLLLRVHFLIFDHLLRAREKEKEGDILKRNSGIEFPRNFPVDYLLLVTSARFLNATTRRRS